MSISNTKNTKHKKKKTKTAYIDWIPVEVSYTVPTEKYQLFSDGLASIVMKNAN